MYGTCSKNALIPWHSRACCLLILLVRPGKQQVAIAGETENIQAKRPEPGTQAAHMLGQAAPPAAGERLLFRQAEQTRKRDNLASMVQQRHAQGVFGRL